MDIYGNVLKYGGDDYRLTFAMIKTSTDKNVQNKKGKYKKERKNRNFFMCKFECIPL